MRRIYNRGGSIYIGAVAVISKTAEEQCKDEKISYPNSLWVELTVTGGQISFPERKELKRNMLVPELQIEAFDLVVFEQEVIKITRKMPVFHAKDVWGFARKLFVSGVAGVTKQCNEKLDKFCKSCNLRHAFGKHTAAGEKKYQDSKRRRKI